MNKRIYISLICTILLFITLIIFLLQKNFSLSEDRIFEITEGSSVVSIVKQLQSQNIINYSLPYIILLKVESNLFGNLDFKSGEYLILKNDNLLTLKHKFQKHDVYLRKITFIEGNTTAEFLRAIDKSPYLSGNISLTPKEGYLFPDTYYFEKNTARDDLIKIMQNKTTSLLNDFSHKYQTNISLKSKEEVLIMASIIEKETGKNSERSQISGVFYNRLAKRMRLQTDPTVIYAVTKGKYKLERPLSKRDLNSKSAYNTYRIQGLPPTPISNPGYQALYSAFNPEKTDYLYFVSNGKGGHNFSKNLKEHNQNVALLRRIEKAKRNAK
ncbi:MAG: endolytic transglycosylase MltG [Rickettsiales bacterium]|nr:endolytic transglycosylase MltG [Rickettsiales bacterium]